MKKILSILLLLGVMTLQAVDTNDVSYAGFNELTTEQQAKILTDVSKMAKEAKEIPKASDVKAKAKVVSEWVDLGASIGKGLASAAKELGVAVNDFSKTSVGKWTMFLIVFNIIGDTVIHLVGGLTFLIFGVTFTTVLMNRMHPLKIEYGTDGKVKTETRDEMVGDESGGWFWFAYLIIIGISTMIIVSA